MIKKGTLIQNYTTLAGIDIGSAKCCCSIGKINYDTGKIILLGIGESPSTGMKKGSIVNRDQVIEEIESAVRDAESMAHMKIDRANITISGNHIRGLNTQGAIAIHTNGHGHMPNAQPIQPKDIHKVLDMAGAVSFPIDRNILHVIPQEYIIDTMEGVINPIGMTGRRLEARVHLITVAISSITNIKDCVEESGISVDEIIYQGLASALSVITNDEKEMGVAVIDIGADTSDLVVFQNGGVRHSAVIPIGGNSITHDIAMMLQISTAEAEKIKIKYGSAIASMASAELEFELPSENGQLKRSISEHELSRYIEARAGEILQYIAKEISRADMGGPLTYGIVLTGGGSQLNHLAKLSENELNIKTRIGIPSNCGNVIELGSEPKYAASMGLLNWKEFIQNERVLLNGSSGSLGGKMKKWVEGISNWSKGFF